MVRRHVRGRDRPVAVGCLGHRPESVVNADPLLERHDDVHLERRAVVAEGKFLEPLAPDAHHAVARTHRASRMIWAVMSTSPALTWSVMSAHHAAGHFRGGGHRRRWGSRPGTPLWWAAAPRRLVPMITSP